MIPTWKAPLQLPEGGEKSGSVGLQLPALPAEPKLHREPVALNRKHRCENTFSVDYVDKNRFLKTAERTHLSGV
jgi:hypothetical protein